MGDSEPDTLAKIADDIEAAKNWCDGNGDYGTGISSVTELTLGRWADRIRNIDIALDVTDKGDTTQSSTQRAEGGTGMATDEEQKERISDYMDTEEGKHNASLVFFCEIVGVILVSVGVGFLFGAAYGFLLVGAFLLASAIFILRYIKRKGRDDD